MCTLVGSASGTHWRLASNSDNPYTVKSQVVGVVDAAEPFVGAVVRCPGDEVVAWDGMVTRGVNRAGFAFTYAYVPDEAAAPERKDDKLPAQTWSHEMMATTTSTADALDFMRARLGSILSGNYLMADTTGEAVIAEVSAPAGRHDRVRQPVADQQRPGPARLGQPDRVPGAVRPVVAPAG
jgi:hypothetical protein